MYPVIHAVHVILQILLWLFYCFMNSFIYSFISLAHIIFFCCCLVCLKICTLKSLSTINIFLFTDMFMKQIITQISPAHNCTLQMFISCMSCSTPLKPLKMLNHTTNILLKVIQVADISEQLLERKTPVTYTLELTLYYGNISRIESITQHWSVLIL